MVNLRDRDNLRREDKSPVPKVSSLRRFDCISRGLVSQLDEKLKDLGKHLDREAFRKMFKKMMISKQLFRVSISLSICT